MGGLPVLLIQVGIALWSKYRGIQDIEVVTKYYANHSESS